MPPPTIAKRKSMGIRQFNLTCARRDSRRSFKVTLEETGWPENLPFPDIAMVRRFTCIKCGGRDVQLVPDRTTHRAAGV